MKQSTDFQPGETIIWCDEEYEVVENNGVSGTVKQPGLLLTHFMWDAFGERAKRKE